MKKQWVLLTFALGLGGVLQAQAISQRAVITGGGSRGEGKCTIEVNVDTAAQVEVRGDTAFVRTLRGQPAELRRFQCNIPMPVNPAGLRFQGVDGRGRQQLVRDNRNTGAVVVYIEDPDNGREGYTFDLVWPTGFSSGPYGGDPRYGQPYPNGPVGGGNPPQQGYPQNYPPQNYPPQNYPPAQNYPDGRYDDHRNGGFRPGFNQRDAVEACEDTVRRQANERYGLRGISFRDVHLELDRDRDHGRTEGWFEASDGYDRDRYRFTCRVDFDSRQIGLIDIDRLRRR